MTTSVDVTGGQRKCSRYVDVFLDETPHVIAPQSDASNEWVNFAVGEAGQVNNANSDKEKGKRVLHICEDENEQAVKDAQRRVKPWYKRIF